MPFKIHESIKGENFIRIINIWLSCLAILEKITQIYKNKK